MSKNQYAVIIVQELKLKKNSLSNNVDFTFL